MSVPIRSLPSELRRQYNAERARAWRNAHPERAREAQRRWYNAHRDTKLAADRARREKRKCSFKDYIAHVDFIHRIDDKALIAQPGLQCLDSDFEAINRGIAEA